MTNAKLGAHVRTSPGAMRPNFWISALLSLAPCGAVIAQQPVAMTRQAAVRAALMTGPRIAVAAADTLVAAAQALTAGAWSNPLLSASYTRSVPNYHVTAELPLDALWLRNTRLGAAAATQLAARYRFVLDSATMVLDVDTTYTRAVAATARRELSARTALAADSIRRIAVIRRDAGDASDLDVELATISAGQAANAAAADSAALGATALALHGMTGLPPDLPLAEQLDSLVWTEPPGANSNDSSLAIASATLALRSADFVLRLQTRSRFGFPGLMFGFETGDPTGAERGVLPTVGITIPIPLLNHNQGPIAEARAERQRAAATLAFARISVRTDLARLAAARAAAVARLGRDTALIASANRVAGMSLVAYREGAAPLTSVLEAQRTARDILTQYIDDVATAAIATATLRVLALTTTSASSP